MASFANCLLSAAIHGRSVQAGNVRLLLMGAVAVLSLGAIAVPAEHLESWRPVVSLHPSVKGSSSTDLAPVRAAIVVDVVESQKLHDIGSATLASRMRAAVGSEGLQPQSPIVHPLRLENGRRATTFRGPHPLLHAGLAFAPTQDRTVSADALDVEVGQRQRRRTGVALLLFRRSE